MADSSGVSAITASRSARRWSTIGRATSAISVRWATTDVAELLLLILRQRDVGPKLREPAAERAVPAGRALLGGRVKGGDAGDGDEAGDRGDNESFAVHGRLPSDSPAAHIRRGRRTSSYPIAEWRGPPSRLPRPSEPARPAPGPRRRGRQDLRSKR